MGRASYDALACVVRRRAMGGGHVTRSASNEMSGISPGPSGCRDGVGTGVERVITESLRRQHRGWFGNKASRSDQVQGVRVSEMTEWSRPFGAVFVRAMRGGDYVVKIVSS